MKTKEKRNILILLIISILIIIAENVYINFNTPNIEEQISNKEVLLGTTDVHGEGIIININDGNDLIHQEDIVILLDELKNAGAEAISVNGQRIVSNTYVYCDGSVIMQNVVNEKNSVKKLKKIDKLIGNLSVSGSGVEITIDTSKTSDITAITLLQLINDLNSAGAEAISINDNRIVNMTDLMDINKEYILVDSNCVSSPYVIKAIGNINKLRTTMNLENSTISKLRRSGKNIEEKYKTYLKIDEYTVSRGQNKLLQKYIK